MEREILFKAKRVDNGEWVYGDLIHLDDRIMISGKDMPAYDNGDIYCNVELMCVEVNPETVCQFTGILDKNGNKIFEGDNDQNYEVVKWCDKRNGYSMWTYDHPTKDFIHCNCYSCEGHYEIADVINEIEITGNIHDK